MGFRGTLSVAEGGRRGGPEQRPSSGPPPELTRGNYRLADARRDGEAWIGRAEFRHNGTWGTVCDDLFNNNAAQVFCRSLGAPGGRMTGNQAGTGRTWLDNVQCTGTEANLEACRHNPIGTENCSHGEDVQVRCG